MAESYMDETCCNQLSEEAKIEFIHYTAKSQGLTSDQILKLIHAIESKQISEKSKFQLIKCLIPQEFVPEEAFIRMTCFLCQKINSELKLEILRWMITAYPFLKTSAQDKFRLLYEPLLNLLQQEILLPYVCHLLYLITNKDSVTLRRVHYLHKLMGKYGYQPCLVLILITYYNLSPGLFDEEIKVDLQYRFESLGDFPDLMICVHPSYDLNVSGVFVTACTQEGEANENETGNLFSEFYQEFKILEKTTNISKILKSKFRRFFLTSDIPWKIRIKIYDYMMTSLYQNFSSSDFLEDVLKIFKDMQKSVAPLSDFIEVLVSSWNGYSNLDIYTAILEIQPICCFEKIRYTMDCIHEKLLKASIPVKCQLFYCFSKMYQNWVLIEYGQYQLVPCEGKCSAFSEDDNCCSSGGNSSTSAMCGSHLPLHEILKLGIYIDSVCNTLALDENSETCLLNEVLMHYERMSICHMKVDNLVLHLPTVPVFQAALFSLNAFTLDNLCRLMLRYNAEINYMQNKGNLEAKHASQCFKLCLFDVHKLLCEGYCYGETENSYLSRTKVFKRLQKEYENFEKLLIIYRHGAVLGKKLSVRSLQSHPICCCKSIPAFSLDLLQNLAEDGIENLVKLISLLL